MTFETDKTEPAIKIPEPQWYTAARSKLGEREIAGDADNPFIVECLKLAGLPAGMLEDETPWCGSFANWCVRQAGLTGPKGPAAARNWLTWGEPLASPVPGCVVVFSRHPNPASGHVGFVAGIGPGPFIQVLGGNQGNAVSVKPYPRARLLGYRWPAGVPLVQRGM